MQLSAPGKGLRTCANKVPFKKLIMQLSVLLILLSGVPARAHVFSQTVSLAMNNTPLEKVFVEIKKQTGYTFAYFESDLAKARPVTINVANAKLTEVLAVLFEGQPLTYTIVDKVIVVKTKSEKKIVVSGDALLALPIDVRGRVVNENGDAVEATITVKGTKEGTSTTAAGDFILRNIDPNATLVVTGVNIEPTEESIRGRSSILIIRVKSKTGKLDEVQVIAYGTTSQRFTTGNIGSVKAVDIEKQPVNNPLLALQGRIPGVQVIQSTGVAGGGVAIRIQGRNNLNTSFTGSDPLIVIDGVPYPSQNLKTFKGGNATTYGTILNNSSGLPNSTQDPQGSPLSYINPADIESIDILKDAEATAIYGSRAANGAVLITTKKGKAGDTKVDINVQQGWGQVARKLDLLNSKQYMDMRREAKQNDRAAIATADYDLRGLWDTTRYTDWQEELIGGTAAWSRLVASISGGSGNVSYLVSGTYGRETTVFPGNFANTKGSIHLNLNATNKNQRFRLQISTTYGVDKNALPSEDFTARAVGFAPVAPALYNTDGTLNWAPDPLANGNSSWQNPLSNRYTLFDNKTSNLISNFLMSYRILPGLEIKSSFGYNNLTTDQFNGALNNAFKPENRPTRIRSASFNFSSIKSWIVEPQITWRKNTGIGKFDVLLGSTIQQQDNQGRNFDVSGQPSDQQLKDMASATNVSLGIVDISTYRYNALFGRLGYSLKDRYLVSLTARRDGSSRFGPANLFHNFGAVGLGWIFSQESWLQDNISLLSFGKLRGSYGTTGNDQIGNYQYMDLFQTSRPAIPYQGVAGLSPNSLFNPYLEWEETRKFQAGIDLGFLKDRILFTINYVRNRSSNNLISQDIPITTGFNTITDNLNALIQNTAWEFSLTTELIKKRDLSWNSSFNLTIPNNKLLAFPGLETSVYANLYIVGQSLSYARDNAFYGVNPLTGLYSLSTVDALYNTAAKYYGGFQNSIIYKGLELSFLLDFRKQTAKNITGLSIPGRFNATTALGNQPIDILNHWQKPGDIMPYQKFTSLIVPNYAGDRDLKDASYIKLRNIALSYRLPSSVIKKIHVDSFRFFINAQNFFTFTKYNGFDPETLSITSLPPLRMVAIGVQVSL